MPFNLVAGQRIIRVRVLATSGIATGMGMCESTIPDPIPPRLDLDITTIPGDPPRPEPTPVPAPLERPRRPGRIRARLSDESGRMDTSTRLRWFDQNGRNIGHGAMLDLRRLPRTVQQVSLLAVDEVAYDGIRRRTWQVKRDGGTVELVPFEPKPADVSYERHEDAGHESDVRRDETTDDYNSD